MAVFRIEKSKDFTIMSNHHLRNKSLSLKAKGLQSLMLSLPEMWDYSLKGLAKICKDGEVSIGTALQELERHGYLTRQQIRDDKGKFLDLEYTIHELPVLPVENPVDNSTPELGEPDQGYPQLENPNPAKPDSGKRAQLNTNSNQIIKKSNTDLLNTHQSIRADAPDVMDAIGIYREILKENISFDILRHNHSHKDEEIRELLELMLETVCSAKKTIRVNSEDMPAEYVKDRIMRLNYTHIEYILENLDENTIDVRNIKSYLLTALYNAPSTISNDARSRVNRDFHGDN